MAARLHYKLANVKKNKCPIKRLIALTKKIHAFTWLKKTKSKWTSFTCGIHKPMK